MASRTRVTVKVDPKAVQALSAPDGLVDRAVARAAGKVRDESRRVIYSEGRVRTGKMAQTLYSRRASSAGKATIYRVGSDLRYARFQHDGVRGRVYPRRAKALRFKPKGGGTFVFAASTAGFRGIFFLKKGLATLKPSDFAG